MNLDSHTQGNGQPIVSATNNAPTTINMDRVYRDMISIAEKKRNRSIQMAREEYNRDIAALESIRTRFGDHPTIIERVARPDHPRRERSIRNPGLRQALREFVANQTSEFSNQDIVAAMKSQLPNLTAGRVSVEMCSLNRDMEYRWVSSKKKIMPGRSQPQVYYTKCNSIQNQNMVVEHA
jgi:hypothetical protein